MRINTIIITIGMICSKLGHSYDNFDMGVLRRHSIIHALYGNMLILTFMTNECMTINPCQDTATIQHRTGLRRLINIFELIPDKLSNLPRQSIVAHKIRSMSLRCEMLSIN